MNVLSVRRISVLAVVSFGVMFSNCGPEAVPQDTVPNSDTADIVAELRQDHAVIVVDSKDLSAVSGSLTDYQTISSKVSHVAVNDVLVSDVSVAAPNGFLRRVTAVHQNSAGLLLTTEQATLEDVFAQAHFKKEIAFAPDGSPSNASPTVRTKTGSKELSVSLNRYVAFDRDGNLSTTDDQVRLSGSIVVQSRYSVDLSISRKSMSHLAFEGDATLTRDLTIDANVPLAHFDKKFSVATFNLAPMHFFIGIIPIVIKPVVTVWVDINGEVSVSLNSQVSSTTTSSLAVHYDGGHWQSSVVMPKTVTDVQVSGVPMISGAQAQLGVYAGPQIALLFYGVAGPYANVFGRAELDAQLPDRTWNLSAGVQVNGGVEGSIFGKSFSYGTQIYEHMWPVKSGTF